MGDSKRYGRITVFHAKPLAGTDKTGKLVPIRTLDLEKEKTIVDETLKEAKNQTGNEIDVEFSGCTTDDVTAVLAHGRSSILHFSGHAASSPQPYAFFEDGQGGVHVLGRVQGEIQQLFEAHNNNVKVVFLSMCDSESMGRELLAAGIPHVICCKNGERLNNLAAIEFTRSLYRGVVCGHSLIKSFRTASKVVSSMVSKAELEKFILLPDSKEKERSYKNYHDIQVFPKGYTTATQIETNNISIFPTQPDFLFGRELAIHEALKIKTARLVQITGPKGIGKSSLARAVCKYIYERPRQFLIKPILWLEEKPNHDQCGTPFGELHKLFSVLQSSDLVFQRFCASVSEILKEERALLVIDARELKSNMMIKLGAFICNLFTATEYNRVLVVCPYTEELNIKKLSNHVRVVLPPLDVERSVKLFGIIFFSTRPELATDFTIVKSASELSKLLVPEGEKQETEVHQFMSNRCKTIFRIIGEGNPSKIYDNAIRIQKHEFEALIHIGKKPEFETRIDSRRAIEIEIRHKQQEFNDIVANPKSYPQKAKDYREIIEELHFLLDQFPIQTDFHVKERQLQEAFDKVYSKGKYAEASKIHKQLEHVQESLGREITFSSKVEKTVANFVDETKAVTKEREILLLRKENEILRKENNELRQRLVNPSYQVQASEILYMNEGLEEEINVARPRTKRTFSFVIQKRSSVVNYSYRSSKKYGIVCATNEGCIPRPGGVDWAVATAGGNSLEIDRLKIHGSTTPWGVMRCDTGDAQIVGSESKTYGRLKAPYVIFTAGPSYNYMSFLQKRPTHKKDILLRCAYRSCLKRAEENGLEAVGFSLISSGIRSGGNPAHPLRIAVEELSQCKGYKGLKQITICAYSKLECEILDSIAKELNV